MRFQRGAVRLPTKRNAGSNGPSAQPDYVADSIEEIVQFEAVSTWIWGPVTT
jgi:hypothetical protein